MGSSVRDCRFERKDLGFRHAAVDRRRLAARPSSRWRTPASTCCPCKTTLAGGEASCRPTSRWMPRTCSCGSSSGFAGRTRASARQRGSARSSEPTAPGRTSTAAPVSFPRRSRPTGRCGSRRPPRGPAHALRGRVRPSGRRPGARAGVHARVARAVRPMVMGRGPGAATGDHPADAVGPAERL